MASIDIFGKLVAGYTGPLTSADQVAYSETEDGKTQRSVKDEIDALKQQSTGSTGDITQIKADLEKKADQTALDTTNSNVTKAQETADAASAAAKAAQDTADGKVAKVKAGSAIIVDSNTATAPVVSVELAETQGNVILDVANGLKASIDAAEVAKITTVNGVKTDDAFLTLGADKLISAVASLKYDTEGKKIQLIGKDGTTVVSEIDASAFIKDGMLDTVELVENPEGQEEGTYLKLTWNTDSGKADPMYVNLTDLIDVYTNGTGLKLVGREFSIDDTVVATKTWANETFDAKGAAAGVQEAVEAHTINSKALSSNPVLDGTDIKVGGESTQSTVNVATAIKTLEDRVATAEGKAGVTSIDGKAGAFTVKNGQTDNGKVNIVVSAGKEISAEIVGLGSAAFTDSSTYDAKGSAAAVDSKLTEATASLSKTISDNKTDAETKITGVRTDLTNDLSAAKAELLGEGIGDEKSTIKKAEAKADAAQTAADEAKAAAKSESAAAITALGSASLSATAGTFITGVTVNQGKLTAVTSGSVAATQVSYSGSNVGASLDSIKEDVANIKGTGTGSISSQIDTRLNKLTTSVVNPGAAQAGSTTTTQIKITVSEVSGKLSAVEVLAPTFALPSDVTSAVSAAKTELVGKAGTSGTIANAEDLANKAQTAADEAKTAAAEAKTEAASVYVKKAGDEMTGELKMVAATGGTGCTIKYNATDAALEFVFE